MSSGANIGRPADVGIGNNRWTWVRGEVPARLAGLRGGAADRRYTQRLNPLSLNGKRPQALFVLLPLKLVQETLGAPVTSAVSASTTAAPATRSTTP
jgi:hypothetical protein